LVRFNAVRARLAAAGSTKEIFTSDAIAILHEAASGSLQDIDASPTTPCATGLRPRREVWFRPADA
jgi:hypothetical protein